LRVRAKYAPGTADYDGSYREVRWDLSGCNLRCEFCWSPASRPSETLDPCVSVSPSAVLERTRKVIGDPSRAFLRFTGGEPTLQWEGLLDAIANTRTPPVQRRPPILIQTNGIEIGRGGVDLTTLATDPQQLYLFELSLKGTNACEFALLTGRSPELYELQLEGYTRLRELALEHPHVAVVAVLGVYHSSVGGLSRYAFIDPQSRTLLFDDVRAWHPGFAAAWKAAPLKWVEPLRMSPKGMWDKVLVRCGPNGAGLLAHFPNGVATNTLGRFPSKPRSADYARRIITGGYWPRQVTRGLPEWSPAPAPIPTLVGRPTKPQPTEPDSSPIPGVVRAGSVVTLSDGSTYRMGVDVQMTSPVGIALAGRAAGDLVAVSTPGGLRKFEIVKID
jgi:uncharacterized Fe-S cluster-containing radical SAM superfamily protein